MPGRRRTGLEALENGDVLSGIGGFSHKKSPAFLPFSGSLKFTRRTGRRRLSRGSPRRPWRPAREAPRPRFRAASSAPCATCAAVGVGRSALAVSAASRVAVRNRSRDESERLRAGARAARGSRRPRYPSSNAQTASLVCTTSVPSRVMRAGQAFRATRSPTAAGQASTTSPRRPASPKRASWRRTAPAIRSGSRHARGTGRHLDQLVGSGRKRRRAGRGDQRLPGTANPACERPRGEARRAPRARRPAAATAGSAPSPPEAPPRRAAARARPAAALPASRTRAARASRPRAATSSRCGPRPVAPRSRSRSMRASSASTVGGSPSYSSRPSGSPSSAARSAKRGESSRAVSARVVDELRSELGHPLRPGLERVRRREPRRDPSQRGVALGDRSAVLRRQAGTRRRRAARATRSKYARRTAGPPFTTASRSGVKTSVATSERSCSAARSGEPLTRARLPSPGRSVTWSSSGAPPRSPRTSTRAACSPKRTSCASERVRGEKPCVPTCSASSRFVLPAPFGPTASTSPGSSPSSRRA